MGKVIVRIKLTNLFDLALLSRQLSKRKARQLEVETLVDTGATRLYLKPSVIKQLGLRRVDAVRSRTTNGEAIRFQYEPVQLELMGRKGNFDVIEIPESVPNLLGQVPLEVLDLVVDNKGQKLIGNPEHGGEQMTEEYYPASEMIQQYALVLLAACCGSYAWGDAPPSSGKAPLAKIQISADGRGFVTAKGKPFVPFGLTYFRSGTGWAPQVWKKFDAEATRRDFVRMKELGVNCVRVFISYGSFYQEPGKLEPEGLAKFDQFLRLAEEQGIYVHPTGPDHWEGSPGWARGDRMADENALAATEVFWRLFAARYSGRSVVFGYDLRNEPEMGWDGPVMLKRWNDWLGSKYGSGQKLAQAWSRTNQTFELGSVPVPKANDAPGSRELLDYQCFREDLADEWTRRQVSAIKAADPQALVTVGLIQWSVPSLLPGVRHYAGFRPERQAKLLDFMEIHFYPLDHGAYEYRI